MRAMERRSGRDRRKFERFVVEVDIEWHVGTARRPGTISDLSDGGCFVLSDGDVDDGDPVRLMLPREDGQPLEFAGLVVNHLMEIGFGVQFSEVGSEHGSVLQALRIKGARA